VRVRPVIEHGMRLVRYDKNSDSGWYAGVQFNYVVYDARAPWEGLEGERDRDVGSAEHVHVVGPYRVLVYAHPFTVQSRAGPDDVAISGRVLSSDAAPAVLLTAFVDSTRCLASESRRSESTPAALGGGRPEGGARSGRDRQGAV